MICVHGVHHTDVCPDCKKQFEQDGGFPLMSTYDFQYETRRRILRLEKTVKEMFQMGVGNERAS